MKIQGFAADRSVRIDGRTITPAASQKVFNHSPDGFNWGYGGSGPAQLALAILLASGAPEAVAVRHYQTFKFAVVAAQPQGQNFTIDIDVDDWLKGQADADRRHRNE